MAVCLTPLTICSRELGKTIPVPCGKCERCINKRASGWSFRLMQEEKKCSSAWFITLTYGPSKVPINSNGAQSLSRAKWAYTTGKRGKNKDVKKKRCVAQSDIQAFLKRLRKSHENPRKRITLGAYCKRKIRSCGHPENKKIKYYACGEYGSKRKRPHYHMILFNADVEKIQSAWTYGQVHYGRVSEASVGYTLKYMCKPPVEKEFWKNSVPEYSIQSKGLGKCYVNSNIKNWHNADLLNRLYVNLWDGKKASMPRYYRTRVYNATSLSEVLGYQKGKQESEMDKKELSYTPNDRTQINAAILQSFKKMENAMRERALYSVF